MGGRSYDNKITPSTHKQISLNKTVYSNKEFSDVIDREFSSLIRTSRPVSVEIFFNIYRELFYKIQRSGEPNDKSSTGDPENISHWELIRESQDYINNYKDWRDDVIRNLWTKLNELNEL